MTSNPTPRQPPVAMFGGVMPHWYLLPGSRGDHRWTGSRLADFYGDHDTARAAAQAWCDENGHHLSSWSDADDRVPRSDCICDPSMPSETTPGCPMHRPDVPALHWKQELQEREGEN